MWSHHATHSSPRSHHDQSSTTYHRVIQCSCCLTYSQIGCTNKICCIHNQALLRHLSLLSTVADFPLLHTGILLALVGYIAHSTHLLFNRQLNIATEHGTLGTLIVDWPIIHGEYFHFAMFVYQRVGVCWLVDCLHNLACRQLAVSWCLTRPRFDWDCSQVWSRDMSLKKKKHTKLEEEGYHIRCIHMYTSHIYAYVICIPFINKYIY